MEEDACKTCKRRGDLGLTPEEVHKRVQQYLIDSEKYKKHLESLSEEDRSMFLFKEAVFSARNERGEKPEFPKPEDVGIWLIKSGVFYVSDESNEYHARRSDMGIFRGRYVDVLAEGMQMSGFYPRDQRGYLEENYTYYGLGYIITAPIKDMTADKSLDDLLGGTNAE